MLLICFLRAASRDSKRARSVPHTSHPVWCSLYRCFKRSLKIAAPFKEAALRQLEIFGVPVLGNRWLLLGWNFAALPVNLFGRKGCSPIKGVGRSGARSKRERLTGARSAIYHQHSSLVSGQHTKARSRRFLAAQSVTPASLDRYLVFDDVGGAVYRIEEWFSGFR